MYYYRVEKIIKIYDGDTVRFLVDLGHGTFKKAKYRLFGINTPETRTKDLIEKTKGLASKKWLTDRLVVALNEGNDINITTIKKPNNYEEKKGKYGRYLVSIIIGGVNINGEMVELGLATKYFGGKR